MKILIIEDDANVVEAISLCLQLRWPEVTLSAAVEGSRGMEILESESYDIIILDINLPDMDGFEVLRRIRGYSNVPIIILTVREKEEDQVRGLEMGADDYIIKPFKPRDLIARVNSVLRRTRVSEPTVEQPLVVRGKLILNLTTNEVRLGEEIAKLTPNESKMLYILMNNEKHMIGNGKISQEVWGKEYTSTGAVRTYIRRLRDKLKDKPPQIILSKRGEGYSFVSPT